MTRARWWAGRPKKLARSSKAGLLPRKHYQKINWQGHDSRFRMWCARWPPLRPGTKIALTILRKGAVLSYSALPWATRRLNRAR